MKSKIGSKGQTAMEYMLIIVVITAVIVAIIFWLQSTSQDITTVTNQSSGNYLCGTHTCSINDDCDIPACQAGATCGPDKKCQI